ncbi:RNA polymerase subunit sigma-54 [Rhizobium sp. AC27/96]|nr:RNA polymerase subunit sigma-54 [Rhizobium sp. AC27/96]
MMRKLLPGSDYQGSVVREIGNLKAKALLGGLTGRLRDRLHSADRTLSVVFGGDASPHILIRYQSAEVAGRVTIDAESGLYVFCEFGDCATEIVIATASEERLIEEIALHLCGDYPRPQTVDAAVDILVGQTIEDIERKLILQTLHHCEGDPTHTAFMLGMPLVVLCNRLAGYFANPDSEQPQAAADAGLEARGYRL